MPAPAKFAATYSVTSSAEGFGLRRNDAPLKTPAGADYALPTKPLAEAIAAEWQAQVDKIVPASMPLTQFAATSIDLAGKDRVKIIGGLLDFIDSELLCHRADEPTALMQKQQEVWQPLLDWCAKKYGAAFKIGAGIMPVRQSDGTHNVLHSVLEKLDSFHLAGLAHAADVCGSLVIAFALIEKHLTPEQAAAAAELDALFQMEKWGADPALVQHQETTARELSLCAKWFALLQP